MEVNLIKNNNLRTKPDQTRLGFGTLFTDYMLTLP